MPDPNNPASYENYTIQSGDTLSGIGQQFGVDFNQIATENAIADPNKIFAGQSIRIPKLNQPAPVQPTAPNVQDVKLTLPDVLDSNILEQTPKTSFDLQDVFRRAEQAQTAFQESVTPSLEGLRGLRERYLQALRPNDEEVALGKELTGARSKFRDFELETEERQANELFGGTVKSLGLATGRAQQQGVNRSFESRALSNNVIALAEELGVAQNARQIESQILEGSVNAAQAEFQLQLDLQDRVQQVEDRFIERAMNLDTFTRQKLGDFLSLVEGVNPEDLSPEDEAAITQLALDSGFSPNLVMQGMKATYLASLTDPELPKIGVIGEYYDEDSGEVIKQYGYMDENGQVVYTSGPGGGGFGGGGSVDSNKRVSELSDSEVQTVLASMARIEGFGSSNESARPNRNNNPLNIKLGGATQKWVDQGLARVEGKEAADGGNFLIFNSPEDGFAAAKDLLLNSGIYSNLSLDAALRKWSGGGYGAEVIQGGTNPSTSVIANAAEQAISNMTASFSKDERRSVQGALKNLLQAGDEEQIKNFVISTAIEQLPSAEMKGQAYGRVEALNALDDIEGLISQFEQAGGSLGLLKGNEEQIFQAMGKTSDPQVAQIGSAIAFSIQAYRKAISGAAFTESESKEYEALFPSTKNSSQLNQAKIGALRDRFNGSQRSVLGTRLGSRDIYDNIVGMNRNNEIQASSLVPEETIDQYIFDVLEQPQERTPVDSAFDFAKSAGAVGRFVTQPLVGLGGLIKQSGSIVRSFRDIFGR